MPEISEYKCPCCGGAVKFDSASQKLKCPFCDTEFDIAAMKEGQEKFNTEAQDNINWKSNEIPWEKDEQTGMVVYHCESCGGEIIAEETTGATSCPYCGNQVVVKGIFSGDLRPDLVIPFKLSKKDAKEALKKHISTKKFIPKIFKDDNHIDEIKGIYVPHWLFSCDADADIKFRGEKIRIWSDSDYNYTETSYYDVYRSGTLSFDNVPVDGSKNMPNDLMESIEPFDLSEAVDFNTAYLAGYLADKYDVSADDCIERANERIKESTAWEFERTITGYSALNPESSSMHIEKGSYKYALYPVWILHTSWNNQHFLFAMNGQTGKIVGNLPLDKKAFGKWLSIAGVGISAAVYGLQWLIALL